MPPGTRPEIALLLSCARTRVDSEHVEQIRTLLREDINWQYLMQAAQAQGVTPLLYRSLQTNCLEAVPQTFLSQLRRHFHANALHNLFLASELRKIFRLFEAHGIPVIPFKGPTLATLAYGDLSLRQFGDLDILIHKKDLVRAQELLVSQGYQLKLTEAEEAAFFHSHFHFNFVRTDGRAIVELHWALTGKHWPFPFDFERLQACLIPVLCGGATICSLSPEDLLLFLCVHGSRHQWERLMWLCDIAELIRAHPQMEWQRLLEQAKTTGSKRMLLLSLFLANNLLGADLPDSVWQNIQEDPKVKVLAGKVWARFSAHATGLPELADRSAFYTHAFLFNVRERLRDKVQYLVHYPFDLHTSSLQLLFNTARVDETGHMPLFVPPFLAAFYSQRVRPVQRVVQYVLRRVKALLRF
jgi:hypothetical protein